MASSELGVMAEGADCCCELRRRKGQREKGKTEREGTRTLTHG